MPNDDSVIIPELDPYEELRSFVRNRELLREGRNPSWFLAPYHVANISRDSDRTTQMLFARYDEAASAEDLPLYVVLARLVNYMPSLKDLDFRAPFTEAFARDFCGYLDHCAEARIAMFSTTSYIAYQYKDSGSKLLTHVLQPMLNNKKHVCGVLRKGFPKDVYTLLKRHQTVGAFAASEILQDLLYIRGNDAVWDRFPPTYYASTALNVLKGRLMEVYIPGALFYAELDEAMYKLGISIDPYAMGRLLHLFGKYYLVPSSRLSPYRPQRAITDTRPSFDLYLSGKRSSSGEDAYASTN